MGTGQAMCPTRGLAPLARAALACLGVCVLAVHAGAQAEESLTFPSW